jgi:hypothetical protein
MADLPPQQPPTGGYGGPPFGSQEEPLGVHEVKGFFGSLFDFSFRSFITGRLIRVLYVLAMIGLASGPWGGWPRHWCRRTGGSSFWDWSAPRWPSSSD